MKRKYKIISIILVVIAVPTAIFSFNTIGKTKYENLSPAELSTLRNDKIADSNHFQEVKTKNLFMSTDDQITFLKKMNRKHNLGIDNDLFDLAKEQAPEQLPDGDHTWILTPYFLDQNSDDQIVVQSMNTLLAVVLDEYKNYLVDYQDDLYQFQSEDLIGETNQIFQKDIVNQNNRQANPQPGLYWEQITLNANYIKFNEDLSAHQASIAFMLYNKDWINVNIWPIYENDISLSQMEDIKSCLAISGLLKDRMNANVQPEPYALFFRPKSVIKDKKNDRATPYPTIDSSRHLSIGVNCDMNILTGTAQRVE